mmetsp:Transcript_9510/g.29331  ORF Transcript_9510/g.29331 Transcript_9510/m.29331 type:complete len:346 (-) Transcript_9510:76-1113(-)|eukprot:CAMPEP_0174239494 /NCGR_PEP_ID=MMETSP0417-20130205/14957_1 /TAXON_ID=242541 /ORGANISM="Mayorella sp, Strain BSH-02190019" /LENGTH=345 /DNA_ID=CAMNT_0015318441 /DNA_START=46 /DNA_END=1083 /DNA_ORIENTATION=-
MSTPTWMPKIKGLDSRSAAEKQAAHDNHSAVLASLKALCKQPGNTECADCTARYPGWVSLPHGVFICIACAQVHRGIGRHISQVKCISSGTYVFYEDEVEALRTMGNTRAASIYRGRGAPPKPAQSASRTEHEQYIRNVYEYQRYLRAPSASGQSPSLGSVQSKGPGTSSATKLNAKPPLLDFAGATLPATSMSTATASSGNGDDWFGNFGRSPATNPSSHHAPCVTYGSNYRPAVGVALSSTMTADSVSSPASSDWFADDVFAGTPPTTTATKSALVSPTPTPTPTTAPTPTPTPTLTLSPTPNPTAYSDAVYAQATAEILSLYQQPTAPVYRPTAPVYRPTTF